MTRVPAIALLCAAALAPPAARADEADAFAGKIRPISGQLYRKAGRFELSPAVELSLDDAFFTKVLFGGRAGWHLSDTWALSGSFAGGFASATDADSPAAWATCTKESSGSTRRARRSGKLEFNKSSAPIITGKCRFNSSTRLPGSSRTSGEDGGWRMEDGSSPPAVLPTPAAPAESRRD